MLGKRSEIQEKIESLDQRLMEIDGLDLLREERITLVKELSDIQYLTQIHLMQNTKIQWGC